MKGKIRLEIKEEDGTTVELITDFHFRMRDLESFFVTNNDEIIAMIGRIERVFEWSEELENEFIAELSGRK